MVCDLQQYHLEYVITSMGMKILERAEEMNAATYRHSAA